MLAFGQPILTGLFSIRFPYRFDGGLARAVPIGGLALRARNGHEADQFSVVPDDLGEPHMLASLAGALHDLRALGLCHLDN